MKIFFDTEFLENGKTIELISIGMVREDGETYYAETIRGGYLAQQDPWLKANVFPFLNLPFEDKKDTSAIAVDIKKFVGENPEFWAYYADYDWVVLCQLYGRMIDLPEGWPMFCLDLRQFKYHLSNPKLPDQSGAEHNAMEDALWNKQVYEYLVNLKDKI